MKKTFAWILLISIMLSLVSFPAAAAETEPASTYITVIQVDSDLQEDIEENEVIGLERFYNHVLVYEDGDDLLFSSEDLARFSGFKRTVKNDTITFTRGLKTVKVDCKAGTVTVMDQDFRFQLPSDIVEAGGDYYLSGAGMLPWLNLHPTLMDGKLILAATPVSLWELMEDIDPSKDTFSVKNVAKILGIKEKKLEKAIDKYQQNYKMSMKFITGHTDSDVDMYYDIFCDMIMDETAAKVSHDVIAEKLDILSYLADIPGLVLCAQYPQASGPDIFDIAGKTLTVSKGMLSLMTYNAVFTEDLSLKLDILENLIAKCPQDYDRMMIDAANQVANKFTDYWTGIFQTVAYEVAMNRSELYNIPEVYNLLNVEAPAEEQMYRIHGYQTIMESIAPKLKSGPLNYSYKTLRSWLLHAAMYYYALEQCYWGVAQYAIDTQAGWTKLDQLRTLAGDAQKMYGKLLTAAMYLEYDNCTEDYGEGWAENYLRLLAQVQRLDFDPVIEIAEYALYGESWNRDMTFQMNMWISEDIDADGEQELILQGVYSDYSKTTMVTLDGSYLSSISGKNFNTCYSPDGSKVYLEEYTETGITYYSWDGKQWLPVSQPTLGEYAMLHIGENQDHTISGDPGTLISLLDGYFPSREGYMRSLTLDVDADGDQDRLYMIEGAANLWNRRLVAQDGITAKIPQYEHLDRNVSLLLVLSEPGGVRLRVQQLHLPVDINAQLVSETEYSGNILRVGMQRYYYMDFGESFTLYPMYESDFLTLMSMSWKEASKLLTKTRLWKTEDSHIDIGRGYLNGMLVQLMVNGEKNQDPGAVLSVSMMDWFPELYDLGLPELVGMRSQKGLDSLENISGWKAMEWVKDINGEDLKRTQTYYLDPLSGEIYLILVYVRDNSYGGDIVRVDTKLIETPPEGVREELEAQIG